MTKRIGPGFCPSCGGEYGDHLEGCPRRSKPDPALTYEPASVIAELRAQLAERDAEVERLRNVEKILRAVSTEYQYLKEGAHIDVKTGAVLIRQRDEAHAKALAAETRLAGMEKVLRLVLSHRSEDKDGNYVCWIGESTFIHCENALQPAQAGEKKAD